MNKTALVTGGSRGIGKAVVEAFASKGWKVAFTFKNSTDAAEALEAQTGALAIKADAADPKDAVDHVKAAERALAGEDGFDAVVINAGICYSGLFQDMTLQEWEEMRGINLDGAIYTLQTILPGMISAKRGSVVLVSSVWGQTGASCEAGYSATKAALIGLGKSLAKELGPSGIRVNVICPGVIDTDMNKGYTEDEICGLRGEIPLGRMGAPKEVADLITFLAGDESGYITGQTIGIDGGFMV